MIIPNGQTCNKFFCLLQPLHDAWVNNTKFNILLPDKALSDYDNLVKSPYLSFPLWKPKLAKFIGFKKYEDLIRRSIKYLILKNPVISTSFKTKHLKRTWDQRSFYVDDNFLQIVKHTFRPNKELITSVNEEFQKYKDHTIIGIHIRKGDYRTFHGGKYYFTEEFWVTILKKLVNQFGQSVVFFISSNENINWNIFEEYNIFRLQNIVGATADLYGLSICDYIIGPPSTFSNWAALIGERPLCHIKNKYNPEIQFSIPRNNIGIE